MSQIRGSYPTRRRIYWIQDNLSANWTPDIRKYAATNNTFAYALARHITYRNGEHRNRRLIAAENRHRIAA
jgi:hypothetical protein